MGKLHLPDILDNALEFSANCDAENFIYDLLAVYGIAKASIARMRQSNEPFMLNNKVHYKPTDSGLEAAIEELAASPKTKKKSSRFLVATDFTRIRALDTKTDELLDVALEDFFEDYGFFLPWTGREKVQVYEEVEADQKAAQKMAKLFEIICMDDPIRAPEAVDELNHFFSRLIFCYYAEDTSIFEKNAFTNYIENYTDHDGSNTADALRDIFKTLSTSSRNGTLNNLKVFPYVNGGLFEDDYEVPAISSRSRRMLIECGRITWAKINPDIFGSMFQGVMDDDIRHELGAHYTSVPNIMKVINPLFMDDLREEFEKCRRNSKRLLKLQQRISEIKIFDPACGSGNFLITAYKELRHLEMDIIEAIGGQLGCLSLMSVDQFHGIEINPFAVELAKLSMWLAEHQMNLEFQMKFTVAVPSIPLKSSARIVVGNACRVDWDDVCTKRDGSEIYILGNPPYKGARVQTKSQKHDLEHCFCGDPKFKDADYISCWFLKVARYLTDGNYAAFVTTNSICQGDHVDLLWPLIYGKGIEIFFACESFKWKNRARSNAGVICTIIGLRPVENAKKRIYSPHLNTTVKNINSYLLDGPDVIISKRKKSISHLPRMCFGTMPRDGGHLILSQEKRDKLETQFPASKPLFKKFVGSNEFIRGLVRWCLWIEDEQLDLANSIPPIAERIRAVYEFRIHSSAKTTNDYASIPHKMAQRAHQSSLSLIVPRVSSERRVYVPIGFLDGDTVISDSANAVYGATPWLFSLLTSRMHMAWMRTACGRLKTDYRYSSALCYNTFPIPKYQATQRRALEELGHAIVEARDLHPGKTLAQLYDPDEMPHNLRDAHHELDLAVDQIYRREPFKNDGERLTHLFKLYGRMTTGGKR
jgi:hypothetical protein